MPKRKTARGTKKNRTLVEKKMSKVMKEYRRGELKMGRTGKKVRSRKQAIAIGLSEARAKGARIPRRKRR